jgi:CRP-like cAMP-binding protein
MYIREFLRIDGAFPINLCYKRVIVRNVHRALPAERGFVLPPHHPRETDVADAPNPLDLFVRTLSLHGPLAAEDREALLALPCTLRTLDPQSYTVREGDAPTLCCILLSGFAYRQKLTGDGSRQIVSLHIPGDPLDLQNLFLDLADHNVQTLTRAELAFIPRDAIRALVRSHPAIAHAIFVAILIEASVCREWVLNVGRRGARARLAHLLCEFAARLEAQGLAGDYGYQLPMSQEQLADALGLTPVHVNRTLKALETDGLIRRDKRFVSFPDWKRMRDFADFTVRYLHLEPQVA